MQQTPPRTPAPAADPKPFIVNVPQAGAPMTAQEVQGLRVKLNDLREELQDAASRRRTVSEQLRSADSRALTGLEERLGVLDARIVEIEKEISATGAQLRNVAPALLAETAPPGPREAFEIANRVSDEIVPIVAIISVFVFAPFAIAVSRFIWRRSGPPPRAAVADQATQQRLEQLQQSVDTIAIEIERISEGQRFVTKLLNERPALGAGAAEPIRASQKKSAVPSERG